MPDWHDFEAWALTERRGGMSPATVASVMKRLRYMARLGIDWRRFATHPDAARAQARDFLAVVAATGRRHAVRNYCKTLNWLAEWLATRDDRFGTLRWVLPRQPVADRRVATDDELGRLLNYSCPNDVRCARRRCLVWIFWATGLRRGEVGDLRVQDFSRDRCSVVVNHPRKLGARREVPLPPDSWAPDGPLATWLRLRPSVPGGWLWVTLHGTRMKPDIVINCDLYRMGLDLGFAVSATRIRHWRGQMLRMHAVPLQVGQAAYGHATPAMTQHYWGQVTAQEMREAYERAGVPGFGKPTPGAPVQPSGPRQRTLAAWQS